MCPYAQAVLDGMGETDDATLVVLTTTCDQMRHGAGLAADDRVFLLNVPATWQSDASREYYAAELRRLGRWLVERGAREPSSEGLARAMLGNDAARAAFLEGGLPDEAPAWCNPVAVDLAREARTAQTDAVPVGLLGSVLLSHDLTMVRVIHEAGGRIVFDGTCGGPRTLPDRFDATAAERDPFAELVRAYFDGVPAIFQRPADRLHAWIAGAIERHQPRGLLCLRRVWCDLWHATAPRLRETAGVAVLDVDLGDEEEGGDQRIASRVEAMIESLRERTPG
jgi:benzoyl-CoA reductase/2-hydroxyglutaryl-CoA dehydratase subunit BcrC/BadD/HgdB